jgi:hypothetical protein
MKILLATGSRFFEDYAQLKACLDPFLEQNHFDMIVAGGCDGADLLVKQYCAKESYYYGEIPVLPWEWDKFGNMAGPMRNNRLIEVFKPVHCVAFLKMGEKNRGTKNCSGQCEDQDIPVTYFNVR